MHPERHIVALLPWGLVFEDFLRPAKLTLEEFCRSFTGSWMFGCAAALRTAGVETVIMPVTAQVDRVTRTVHEPTGTPISLLPAPRRYRALRAKMARPYASSGAATFGLPPWAAALRPAAFAATQLAPYLSTPVRPLLRELGARSCTAILCQEYEFPRFDTCVALRPLHRLPVYATFQGGDHRNWPSESAFRGRAIARADGLFVGSAAERRRVKERYAVPPIAPIANSIDLELWRRGDRSTARLSLGIPADARVVGWHGRVEIHKKGLDTLLDAWRAIAADDRQAYLVLVGDGKDGPKLRTLIEQGGAPRLVWVDRHLHDAAEIAAILSAADVYAFPSRHEGFPLAPVEAMALGLPVVATDISGIRDVLADAEAAGGVLVPTEDGGALAHALMRFLATPSLVVELGEKARAQAERYGHAATGAAMRAFIEEHGRHPVTTL